MVNGNTERSLRTEEHTAALAAEVQSSLSRQFSSPATKRPDTVKHARSNLQQDRLARAEKAYQCGPNPNPRKKATPVLRVHNDAIEIPWAQGEGHHHGTPKTRLKPHQGLPTFFTLFSYFQDSTLRKACSAVQLPHIRCKDQGSRQAMPHYENPRWSLSRAVYLFHILSHSLPLKQTC